MLEWAPGTNSLEVVDLPIVLRRNFEAFMAGTPTVALPLGLFPDVETARAARLELLKSVRKGGGE